MNQRRPKNSGSVSARPRKDGRWESRITLPDGRRRSFYGSSKSEAEEKMYRARMQLEQGVLANPGKAKVEHLWNDYRDLNPDDLRRSSLKVRESAYKNWIAPEIGHVRLAALTPTHVHQVLSTARKSELADGSIANIFSAMRTLFSYGVQIRLMGVNPADQVNPPQSGGKRELPITSPAQIDALMAAIDKSKYRAILTVGIGLGLRVGEARGLRWRDIDLDAKEVRVRHQVDIVDGEIQFVELKTKESRRDLPLPEFVVDALRKERSEQNTRRLRLGSEWEHHDLVFTVKGRPLSRQTVANHMKSVCEVAGVDHMNFHHLRHLCATMLMAHGVQPRVVQAILGHATANTTLQYQHAVKSDLKVALGLLDSLVPAPGINTVEGAS